MTYILGFDSRYTTTIPTDTEYEFAGIKITEAVGGGPYSQPLTQWQLARDRKLARLPFHFWRGSFDDPVTDGKEQARWFFETFQDRFASLAGQNELPPCIDCEDTYATKGLRSLGSIVACLKETEDLWNIPRYSALLYSARWWWDTWIKPYTTADHEIYKWPLWEADPPPETPIGYWSVDDSVIVQIKLDFPKPGFNADIDENYATRTWFESATGTGQGCKSTLFDISGRLIDMADEVVRCANECDDHA